jgi:hypothetical protein
MLDIQQRGEARRLYTTFFERFNQPNPTDLNTEEKFGFAQEIGFEGYRTMQRARKESYNFTRLGWHTAVQRGEIVDSGVPATSETTSLSL